MRRPSLLVWSVAPLWACAGAPAGDGMPANQPALARVYELDVENRARQSYEEYAGYVRMFFEGRGLVPGWNELARRLEAKASEEERAEVAARLARLGWVVAIEWARDNAIRQVDTAALRGWAAALARGAEEGRLREALAAVEREAAHRLDLAGGDPKEVALFGSNPR